MVKQSKISVRQKAILKSSVRNEQIQNLFYYELNNHHAKKIQHSMAEYPFQK